MFYGIHRRAIVICCFFILFIFLTSIGFILFGIPKGHDSFWHIHWLQLFFEQISIDNMYPRVLINDNAGFGSLAFIYYPPLPTYLSGAVQFFSELFGYKGKYHISLGIAIFITNVTGALGVYLVVKQFGNQKQSIVAAMFYTILPYHLLVDTYIRGAYAEIVAMAFLPFLFIYKKSALELFLVISIATACLLLSHPPSSMIVLMCSAIFQLYAHRDNLVKILTAFWGFWVGLLLSSTYILPALTIKMTSLENLWSDWGYYKSNFILSRVSDLWFANDYFFMMLSIIGQSVLLIFLILLAFKCPQYMKINKLLIPIGSLSIVMMTPISIPVYELLPIIQKIQFPWRWSIMTSLILAIYLGLFYSDIKYKKYILLFMVLCLLAPVVVFSIGQTSFFNKKQLLEVINRKYSPIEYNVNHPDLNITEFQRDNKKVLNCEACNIGQWSEDLIVVNGSFQQNQTITFRRNYVLGWESIDNRVNIRANKHGLISVKFLEPASQLKIKRYEYTNERVGGALTLIGILLLVITVIVLSFKNRGKLYE